MVQSRLMHGWTLTVTPPSVRHRVANGGCEHAERAVGTVVVTVDADLLPVSPCRGVRLPAHARKEIRFLSADELERLADAMPAQYRAMTHLAGVLGTALVGGRRPARGPHRLPTQDARDRRDLRRGQRQSRRRAREDEILKAHAERAPVRGHWRRSPITSACTPTSIYYRLRKSGAQIRPRPGWSDEQPQFA
jgi:hypothetical protein